MLTGELVRLRALEPADAEALWRWNSDPEIARWLTEDYPQSRAQVVKRFADRPPMTYDNATFAVDQLGTDRLIGVVVLRDATPETGCAVLDIYLGERDVWGHGHGTDTMRVICRYGFDVMRLHQITLWVVADNARARRVYEKVGFVEEGRQRQTFRREGRWHDLILMGLLEGELID
jgi:RimJ/RimL family protein N-acetyltransferase